MNLNFGENWHIYLAIALVSAASFVVMFKLSEAIK